MYAAYHGPEGLKRIATRVHGLAAVLAEGAKKLGLGVPDKPFFDTVTIKVGVPSHSIACSCLEVLEGCTW